MKRNLTALNVIHHDFGQSLSLLFVAFSCLVGCAKPTGVSYEATALRRRASGIVEHRIKVEPAMAPISSMSEVATDGGKATVQVIDVQKETATFEITFPDNTTERVDVSRDVPHDVFAKGKEVGVEIHVKEIRIKR